MVLEKLANQAPNIPDTKKGSLNFDGSLVHQKIIAKHFCLLDERFILGILTE